MESNYDRALVSIVKEIASEEKIEIILFSYDWIIRLNKGSICKHIVGYEFELNSSSAQLIAKDKSATSDLLNYKNIPTVLHKLFFNPQKIEYIGSTGNWQDILEYSKKFDNNIVCKTNVGTGGNDVIKIKSQIDLENAVHDLFRKYDAISLSPYYKIENEYRVILLSNTPLLIYSKHKPSIIGDGKSSVFDLLVKKFGDKDLINIFKEFDINEKITFSKILDPGEKIELSWKHNLGKGSMPKIVEDATLKNKLAQLAIKAANAINIQFASVDIVETENDFKVLEINSGIMMESFSRFAQNGRAIAKEIYKKAIFEMLK